ncbi:MAG: extracellular solute-binding protein [Treponema sp.]|jgi:raffinose/stachyose/melibiose transport system substrate-binding protein|nr:extracellular solute-binding protein [Treponema sp.]
MKIGKLFVLLALAVVTVLVFSCKGKEAETNAAASKTTLLWLYESADPDKEEALRKNLIDVVNSRAEDYEITIRFDPNYDQNLRTSMLAGAGPDLVQTAGPTYVQEMVRENYLLPLDDYAKKYGWDKIVFPMMQRLGSVDGRLYSLPKTYESMVLFYNKTLFEKNGWQVPETWAEFDTLCAKIKATGITPIVAGNATWKPTNEHYVGIFFNHLAGPENIRAALEGKKPWTDKVFVDAITELQRFFNEYFTKDYFSLGGDDPIAILAAGEAAMFPSGTWNFQNINKFFEAEGQDWDWAPIPSGPGIPYPLYEMAIGATLSINAKSAKPDAIAELLNTLFNEKEVIVNMNADWPGEWCLPINSISSSDFGDRIDHRYARSIEMIADAVSEGNYGYTTWTFWPEKTNQYLWEAIENVFLKQLPPAEYLKNLDDLFQTDLKDDKVPKLP